VATVVFILRQLYQTKIIITVMFKLVFELERLFASTGTMFAFIYFLQQMVGKMAVEPSPATVAGGSEKVLALQESLRPCSVPTQWCVFHSPH
jgi:hypothetical protein